MYTRLLTHNKCLKSVKYFLNKNGALTCFGIGMNAWVIVHHVYVSYKLIVNTFILMETYEN